MATKKKTGKTKAKSGYKGGVIQLATMEYTGGEDRHGFSIGKDNPVGDGTAYAIQRVAIKNDVLFAQGECDTWAIAALNKRDIWQLAQFMADYLGETITGKPSKAG